MIDYITSLLNENPKMEGVIFLSISIMLFIYCFKKKNAFDFENFNFFNWQTFLASWSLALVLLIIGLKDLSTFF